MEKTVNQEEELEKQYRDYKAQFEQWKERNRSSVGTAPYNAYVKDFEDWEKDVERRRNTIKIRAAEEAERRKEAIREAQSQVQEAEAAAAYAQSQQAYLAHHQKAMEQAEMQQRAQAHHQFMQQQHQQQQQQQQHVISDNSVNADVVIREVMNVVMAGTASAVGSAINQQPPPQQGAVATGPPPSLWGNVKSVYDQRDPLFIKWGKRAAPCHIKPDHNAPIVPLPYWILSEALKEKKMVLAPHGPPPVFNPTQPAPPPQSHIF
ncbi:unnamed protein product [Caenorhabditis angaria]|uniref:Uncharacterized protein n=1 Tax=Caenorhabditis angaria TaxID=860376 RepID=A0A9P1IC52_9PELO|nr:unnamed protein product [Caenorhabditis angaria]